MSYTGTVKRLSVATLALAASAACGGGGDTLPTGPSPVAAEVEFRYVVTGIQASSAEAEPACAGRVRFQPSFWGFAQVTLMPVDANTWAARFEEVPVGPHSVRVSAPEGCAGGEIFANGVLLSDAGSTASFAVSADGSIAR